MLVEDKQHESHKPFRLLNALSDLMMLPLEMLADPLTRKEVSTLLASGLCNPNIKHQYCITHKCSNFLHFEGLPIVQPIADQDNSQPFCS